MSLTDFLSSTVNIPFKALTSTGYSASNLDILLGSIKRSKLINQNYISDFMLLETDKNFLRKHPSVKNKLLQLSSKLSLTTQMVTTVNALLTMSKVIEFIPSNVRYILENYIGLADTGILILNNIADGSIMRRMQSALISDILSQFDNSIISARDLQIMATNFFNNYHMFSKIENLGIRSILGIPLTSLLPRGSLGIYEDLVFLDNLYTIFGDETLLTNFMDQFKELLKPFSDTKVQSLAPTKDFADAKITLSDPLGVNAVENLSNIIKDEYIKTTNSYIDEVSKSFNLTSSQITELKQVHSVLITNGFDETFNSNIGLPSLQNVIDGINVESYNQAVEMISSAFQQIPKEIINGMGLSYDEAIEPIDFLYNLKKYIETRNSFKVVGASLDKFNEVDKYVKAIVGDISDVEIQTIYGKILKALKENG